MNLENNNL